MWLLSRRSLSALFGRATAVLCCIYLPDSALPSAGESLHTLSAGCSTSLWTISFLLLVVDRLVLHPQ